MMVSLNTFKKVVSKLNPVHQADSVEEELSQINVERVNDKSTHQQLTVTQVLRTPGIRFALLVYVMVHLSIPLSGMTGIFFYSTSYFRRTGLSCDLSQYTTIGVGLLVILTSVCMLPVMDRFGRRTLYLTCRLYFRTLFSRFFGRSSTLRQCHRQMKIFTASSRFSECRCWYHFKWSVFPQQRSH